MVPVKSMRDYDMVQEVISSQLTTNHCDVTRMFSFVQVMVLFSETVQRAISQKLISVDMIDSYEPSLMFTIPRLAIITCVKPRNSLQHLLSFLLLWYGLQWSVRVSGRTAQSGS